VPALPAPPNTEDAPMNTDDRALADLIAELRGLLANATPQPWVPNHEQPGAYARIETEAHGYFNDGWVIASELLGPDADANIALIVKAVNALPKLLDRLEAFHAKPRSAFDLMQEFYLSSSYDPKAARPADTVQAAIAFTLAALQSAPTVVSGELVEMLKDWRDYFAPDGKRIRLADGNKERLHSILGQVIERLSALPVVSGEFKHGPGCGSHQDYPCDCEAAISARAAVVEEGRREAAAIARIIDPDAWHPLLKEDGCGAHWHGRRAKALAKADAILALTPVEGVGVAGGDVYVPGKFRCPKCDFTLLQSSLSLDGGVADRDSPGEKCPNDGTPLWRVSWKDQAQQMTGAWRSAEDELAALKATPATAQGDVREALEHAIDPHIPLIPGVFDADKRSATIEDIADAVTAVVSGVVEK
jgi:hypothetical protein